MSLVKFITYDMLKSSLFSYLCLYFIAYFLHKMQLSDVVWLYGISWQADICYPLCCAALHRITAPQFIRRSLHLSRRFYLKYDRNP